MFSAALAIGRAPYAALQGYYDYHLVTLSVLMAIAASYATLDLASRVRSVNRFKLTWLTCGAVAMGCGIWAMHYIGMTAYRLPVEVLYHWPTVLLSLAAGIFASGIALGVVSRPPLTQPRALMGSVAMGVGIASMHYIGMDAMRLPAECVYSKAMVAISVLLAIVISFAALRISFAFGQGDNLHFTWRKLGTAALLGLAIPVMHYAGMAAVTFVPMDHIHGGTGLAVSVTSLGLVSIVAVTTILLGVVMLQASSQRKIALKEQEIAEQNAQTRLIFDSLKEGIVVLSAERNITQINNAARQMLGIEDPIPSYKEIQNFFEIRLPSGEKLPMDRWPGALALAGEFLQNCELHITRTDTGRSIVSEVSTAPIYDRDGSIQQIIVSYRDVTQPREIDEARVRLAAIVESSDDAIISKDEHGMVTSWNAGAEKLFGYTSEEMVGRSIQVLVPTDHLEEEDEILTRIRRGEMVDHIETIRRCKNGQFINVSLTISPVRDSAGKIVGASKIARNITEKKMMEGRLYQSMKLEAIGQLTGGIAHDFNNLLGVIVGNLDLLERRLVSDEASLKRIHTAQKAATRGADLTRRLLTFSSREQLRPAALDLQETVESVLELASRGMGPEVSITKYFDPAARIVMADESGLENALLNILVNARDAMPQGGSITISTQLALFDKQHPKVATDGVAPGNYALITISDTGEGMSRDTLNRAFEPFYTTKERTKGTGLGLAMVYGFFKQTGGIVRLYSELGYGTTVSCYLPLADQAVVVADEAARIREDGVTDSGTILLVDDEDDLLEVASTYLKELGYTVYCAKDGADGMAVTQAHPEIDLLVTDVIMPGGMNGAELARQLRTLRPKVKVIYASGFPADALAERKMSLADGPLLHKPYQRSELVSLIRKVTATPEESHFENSATATRLNPNVRENEHTR